MHYVTHCEYHYYYTRHTVEQFKIGQEATHTVHAYARIVQNGEASSKRTELHTKVEAGYSCYSEEVAKPA